MLMDLRGISSRLPLGSLESLESSQALALGEEEDDDQGFKYLRHIDGIEWMCLRDFKAPHLRSSLADATAARTIFYMMDTDLDGNVSVSEFARFLTTQHSSFGLVTHAQARAMLRKIKGPRFHKGTTKHLEPKLSLKDLQQAMRVYGREFDILEQKDATDISLAVIMRALRVRAMVDMALTPLNENENDGYRKQTSTSYKTDAEASRELVTSIAKARATSARERGWRTTGVNAVPTPSRSPSATQRPSCPSTPASATTTTRRSVRRPPKIITVATTPASCPPIELASYRTPQTCKTTTKTPASATQRTPAASLSPSTPYSHDMVDSPASVLPTLLATAISKPKQRARSPQPPTPLSAHKRAGTLPGPNEFFTPLPARLHNKSNLL
ncbi:hypothetical protein PPROV_001043800 [Pycnococcus provasolii]|uniref:EF-hand domain-containing protein n=1 Tax=Pycnococcus provasolii TaxID=41880 RepID=A0A830I0W8_9CHLO|nr:hypothetical protein PPROV_001043800 [Pycnococcus provasolii]